MSSKGSLGYRNGLGQIRPVNRRETSDLPNRGRSNQTTYQTLVEVIFYVRRLETAPPTLAGLVFPTTSNIIRDSVAAFRWNAAY